MYPCARKLIFDPSFSSLPFKVAGDGYLGSNFAVRTTLLANVEGLVIDYNHVRTPRGVIMCCVAHCYQGLYGVIGLCRGST